MAEKSLKENKNTFKSSAPRYRRPGLSSFSDFPVLIKKMVANKELLCNKLREKEKDTARTVGQKKGVKLTSKMRLMQ